MLNKIAWIVPLIIGLVHSVGHGAEGRFSAIALQQPQSSYEAKRVNVQDLANYLKTAQSEILAALKSETLPRSSGLVVFAVRPGMKSNAWLDMEPAWPDDAASRILAVARRVPAFNVVGGDAVFAAKLSIGGAPDTDRVMAAPHAWKVAAQKKPGARLTVDDVVALAWPPEQGADPSGALPPPPEFVVQILDVTEGKVARPKVWHYTYAADQQKIM